jgi:hypothetical protein
MSRADATRALDEIHSAAREFLDHPDLSVRAEVHEILSLRVRFRDLLDASALTAPDAAALRALRSRVAALQLDRLARSEAMPYRATLAAVITLYGISDNTSAATADLAARKLNLPSRDHVRLQDSSDVRTATLTGTRYIFTSRTP